MFKYEEINHSLPYAMPEELEYLRRESFKLSDKDQIVIIGTGPFLMGLAILENHNHPPKVATIDLATFQYAQAHLLGAEVSLDTTTFIQGDSSTIGNIWNIPIDLLVIDGDHSFDGVYKDILAWQGHVRQGGIMFFHDYLYREGGFNGSGEWNPSEVKMAIETCRDSSWQFIKQIGISIVYMKV